MTTDAYHFMLKILLRFALVFAKILAAIGLKADAYALAEWVEVEAQRAKED